MFPENHNKLWSYDDLKFLDKEIKNNKSISESLIDEIAIYLKRTKDSIKYKIIFTHIINEIDVMKDNSNVMNKYNFADDNELINKIFTKKKDKIIYYANNSIFELKKTNIDKEKIILNINKIKNLT